MKYTELKNSISEGAASVYLLEGVDAYFRLHGEEQIKSAFLSMPELNFSSFDGETLKGAALSDLVAALENLPFMSEKRVVRVSEFYPAEGDFEKYLKPLFENFPPQSILIIVNQGGKRGVDLKRKQIVKFVDCSHADGETVAKWAYITLKRAGFAADYAACNLIAEYCLCDMARVASEVEKIIAYAPEGVIDSALVDELVYKDAEYRIYEMTNAVARRDFDKFCTVCDDLVKKSGDEISALNGLFAYFRNLYSIISSKDSDEELAKLLKMKEYGVKKSREQARAIGKARLEGLITCIYSAISDVKSGRITPQGALSNCKNLIFFGD